MNKRFRRAFEWVLDLIFPAVCASCHTPLQGEEANDFLCAACAKRLIFHTTFLCGTCGARLPDFRKICHLSTPFMLAPAGRYEPPISDWITGLKFNRIRGYARPLGLLIARYLINTGFDLSEYVILPMPLHKIRERERGFNQAAEIAVRVANILKLPVESKLLIRDRFTLPQTEMKTFADREKNIENVFRSPESERVRGKKIIIIDDVFTSGSTANAAARALRDAGARTIIVATAAKTV